MKIATKLCLILAFIGFTATATQAQNRPSEGDVGLTASLQSNQTNIMLPIWASNNLVIAPVVGFSNVEDEYTNFNVGINPRFYQKLGSDFATYIGVRGLLQYHSPENSDSSSDFLLGAGVAGEYFLGSHFSLGVEAQLNFLIKDDSHNHFGTGTAIMGTYYF